MTRHRPTLPDIDDTSILEVFTKAGMEIDHELIRAQADLLLKRSPCSGCQGPSAGVYVGDTGSTYPLCVVCLDLVRRAQKLAKRGTPIREALERARSQIDPISERTFCDQLADNLCVQGFTVEREVSVPGGRIDLLATHGNDIRAIEAKTAATTRSISQALGQLLAYGHFRPEASLWFSCPWTVIPGQLRELLASHQVKILHV